MDKWLRTGEEGSDYYYMTWGGYAFSTQEQHAPLMGVRGLLGITVTYNTSPAPLKDKFDLVVCKGCFDDWVATPPWNDTPPTLKVPPTCTHLPADYTP